MSDLTELFSRDPLELSKTDIQVIVARYREARAQFNLGVAQAGSTKKVKGDGPKVDKLDLDDLLKGV